MAAIPSWNATDRSTCASWAGAAGKPRPGRMVTCAASPLRHVAHVIAPVDTTGEPAWRQNGPLILARPQSKMDGGFDHRGSDIRLLRSEKRFPGQCDPARPRLVQSLACGSSPASGYRIGTPHHTRIGDRAPNWPPGLTSCHSIWCPHRPPLVRAFLADGPAVLLSDIPTPYDPDLACDSRLNLPTPATFPSPAHAFLTTPAYLSLLRSRFLQHPYLLVSCYPSYLAFLNLFTLYPHCSPLADPP